MNDETGGTKNINGSVSADALQELREATAFVLEENENLSRLVSSIHPENYDPVQLYGLKKVLTKYCEDQSNLMRMLLPTVEQLVNGGE